MLMLARFSYYMYIYSKKVLNICPEKITQTKVKVIPIQVPELGVVLAIFVNQSLIVAITGIHTKQTQD